MFTLGEPYDPSFLLVSGQILQHRWDVNMSNPFTAQNEAMGIGYPVYYV